MNFRDSCTQRPAISEELHFLLYAFVWCNCSFGGPHVNFIFECLKSVFRNLKTD